MYTHILSTIMIIIIMKILTMIIIIIAITTGQPEVEDAVCTLDLLRHQKDVAGLEAEV